ncbi:hypothetical protein ACFL4G_03980, partial [Thermodesulfobacteriota bacterium]
EPAVVEDPAGAVLVDHLHPDDPALRHWLLLDEPDAAGLPRPPRPFKLSCEAEETECFLNRFQAL